MKWLIETTVWNDGNPEKMINAVTSIGHVPIPFQYVPYKFTKDNSLPIAHQCDEPILVYGSVQFVKICQKLTNWTPCAWCNWDDLKCSSYFYKTNHIVHNDYAYISLGEFIKQKDRLFKLLGRQNTLRSDDLDLFVKCDGNDKVVSGEILSLSMFKEWHDYLIPYSPNLNTMMLLSKPCKVVSEWRCVVSRGIFVTGSQYRMNGDVQISSECPQEIILFATEQAKILKDVSPIFCIDIGKLSTQELKIIEIGSVNCAGLYDCDVSKIVEVASELAIEEVKSFNC